MKLKGTITIARSSGDIEGGRNIHIEIRDELSGVEFVDLRMTAEDFGNACVGSLAFRPCEIEIQGLDKIGKKRENKTEKIKFNRFGGGKREGKMLKEVLAPYEVDGWTARIEDLTDGHRAAGDGCQNVSFVRWVEVNQ